MLLTAIPLGAAIGVAVGMLGGGGSVLAVPVLVYLLGQDVGAATTTSLVVVAAAALAGGAGHALERRVCWRHAVAFTLAALPGIVAGTALGDVAGATTVVVAFAAIMLVAAAATWSRASGAERGAPAGRGDRCPALRAGRDAAAGLVVGLLTGFLGVGGGFVVVPLLVVALAFSMRSAVGTSLAIIAMTSVLGVAVHLAAGRELDVGLTAVLGAACVAGAFAGARVSGRLPQRTLGRAFAGVVVLVAISLLASAAFLGGPPSA